ncbi:MAG: dihydroneopterin aldolase [Flavobacteriales bacterium]|nr:dihydroneopterin aldolase [Flavobacteriales bacterium]
MGLIEVNGIRLQAFHGCLEEEGRIGGNYRVDVAVKADLSAAEATDRLQDTVDYGRITAIVREQMALRSKLIEHVCHRIFQALRAEWPGQYRWRVRLVKERPPIHGNVEEAAYQLEDPAF